jgi:hypothetical protein
MLDGDQQPAAEEEEEEEEEEGDRQEQPKFERGRGLSPRYGGGG